MEEDGEVQETQITIWLDLKWTGKWDNCARMCVNVQECERVWAYCCSVIVCVCVCVCVSASHQCMDCGTVCCAHVKPCFWHVSVYMCGSRIVFTPWLNRAMCWAIWKTFPISSNILPAKRNIGPQLHTAGRQKESSFWICFWLSCESLPTGNRSWQRVHSWRYSSIVFLPVLFMWALHPFSTFLFCLYPFFMALLEVTFQKDTSLWSAHCRTKSNNSAAGFKAAALS